MLAGYFDESGIAANDRVVVVGGLVADTVLWSRIEQRWRAKLEEFGLSMYHAVDCEQRLDEFERYERGVRDALTNYFSALASELQAQAFGSAVSRAAWSSFASSELKARCAGNPYFMALELTFQQISSWSRQYVHAQPVAIVLARQDEYGAQAADIHERYSNFPERFPGLGSLSVSDPRTCFELQVADLFAYEQQRFAARGDEGRAIWKNVASGIGKMAHSFMIYEDKKSFDELNSQIASGTILRDIIAE